MSIDQPQDTLHETLHQLARQIARRAPYPYPRVVLQLVMEARKTRADMTSTVIPYDEGDPAAAKLARRDAGLVLQLLDWADEHAPQLVPGLHVVVAKTLDPLLQRAGQKL